MFMPNQLRELFSVRDPKREPKEKRYVGKSGFALYQNVRVSLQEKGELKKG